MSSCSKTGHWLASPCPFSGRLALFIRLTNIGQALLCARPSSRSWEESNKPDRSLLSGNRYQGQQLGEAEQRATRGSQFQRVGNPPQDTRQVGLMGGDP